MTDLTYCDDAYAAPRALTPLSLLPNGMRFRALDLDRLKASMASPVLVDLRNVYRPKVVEQAGFAYVAVGR